MAIPKKVQNGPRMGYGSPMSSSQGQQSIRHSPRVPNGSSSAGNKDLPDLDSLPDFDERPRETLSQSHVETDFSGREVNVKKNIKSSPNKIQNPYDEEDPFSEVPIEEQFDDDDEDFENVDWDDEPDETPVPEPVPEPEPEPVRIPKSRTRKASQEQSAEKTSRKKRKASKESEPMDEFIDEKNKKLKPFGRRKVKVKEFDNRKNLRTRATIVQWTVITLIAILIGLGVKNAVFPPNSLSENDVSAIAAETVGMTDFPLEEGKGFAQDFIKAYLTTSDDVSSTVLNYYYSGSMSNGGDVTASNRTISSGYKQSILYGPTVYKQEALTDYSASYTVGALVRANAEDSDGTKVQGDPRWMFFNVNVFYNSKQDNFTITPDSPTIIPATEVGQLSEVPSAAQLGNGDTDQDLTPALSSVVYGFLKGYAETTPTDHSGLDQYIVSNPDPTLLKGLAGQYQFNGDVSNAAQYEAFLTDDPATVKVAVTVNWLNTLGSQDSNLQATYTSSYVMTLVKQSNGKYLVSKFAPQYYVMDDNASVPSESDEDGATDEETPQS